MLRLEGAVARFRARARASSSRSARFLVPFSVRPRTPSGLTDPEDVAGRQPGACKLLIHIEVLSRHTQHAHCLEGNTGTRSSARPACVASPRPMFRLWRESGDYRRVRRNDVKRDRCACEGDEAEEIPALAGGGR